MEYVFVTTHQGRPVRVRIGWCRAYQRHYLVVEYTERNEVPLYDYEADRQVSRYTPLNYFIKKLIQLGLSVPKAPVRGLSSAPWQDGGVKAP